MSEQSQVVEKYVDGEWEVVEVKTLVEGDTFRAYTPEDTSDDRTWYIATTNAYQDEETKVWAVDADLIDRDLTEEDGGDLPTEE
jgi:hypothetical protein